MHFGAEAQLIDELYTGDATVGALGAWLRETASKLRAATLTIAQ